MGRRCPCKRPWPSLTPCERADVDEFMVTPGREPRESLAALFAAHLPDASASLLLGDCLFPAACQAPGGNATLYVPNSGQPKSVVDSRRVLTHRVHTVAAPEPGFHFGTHLPASVAYFKHVRLDTGCDAARLSDLADGRAPAAHAPFLVPH